MLLAVTLSSEPAPAEIRSRECARRNLRGNESGIAHIEGTYCRYLSRLAEPAEMAKHTKCNEDRCRKSSQKGPAEQRHILSH